METLTASPDWNSQEFRSYLKKIKANEYNSINLQKYIFREGDAELLADALKDSEVGALTLGGGLNDAGITAILNCLPQKLHYLKIDGAYQHYREGDDSISLFTLFNPPLLAAKLLLDGLGEYTTRDLYELRTNSAKNTIGANSAEALKKALESRPISSLGIINFGKAFNEGSAITLAQALVNSKHLSSLDLSGNDISSEGFKAISASLPPTLIKLNLSGNKGMAADKCMEEFAKNLRYTSLEWLNLKDTGLTDYGLEALARALRGSLIRELNLSSNKIHDSGACALAQVIPHFAMGKYLRPLNINLDLSNNYLTGKGGIALLDSTIWPWITTGYKWGGQRQWSAIKEINLDKNLFGKEEKTAVVAAIERNGTILPDSIYKDYIGRTGIFSDAVLQRPSLNVFGFQPEGRIDPNAGKQK